MGKSDGGGTSTTVTESTLPKEIAPFVQQAMGLGQQLYQTRPLYRPDFNAQQRAGLSQMEGVARNPMLPETAAGFANQQLGMGQDLMADTISQAANPYIEEFAPMITGRAAMLGREGSGTHAELFGQGVGREVAKQYNAQQDRNVRLAGMSPMLEEARLAPGQNLLDIGGAFENRERSQNEELWDRYARYVATAFGNSPAALYQGTGRTTSTQPIHSPSPFQNLLGLGMVASQFFAPRPFPF